MNWRLPALALDAVVLRYRLHFIDRAGCVRRSVDFFCQDDDEAVGHARQHDDHGKMELWQENRRVARFFRTGGTDADG